MAEKIYEYNVLNKTIDYKKISNALYKQIKKRSIIFLIGDFIDASKIGFTTAVPKT